MNVTVGNCSLFVMVKLYRLRSLAESLPVISILIHFIPTFLTKEATTGGVLLKKKFLKILQSSQENNCVEVSYLTKLHDSGLQLYPKRNSKTGVFLLILRCF